ncbi:MAG: hypothetical protein IPL61_01345 [Myxococcales bacterium]|nr:hypothetical protein [Myxococcales bacterium]
MRARLAVIAVIPTVACGAPASSPPPPLPPVAPVHGAAAPAPPAAAPSPPPPLVTCAADARAVRLPWPQRGRACVDGRGRRQGPSVELYPDGAVATRREFVDDVADGRWQALAPDGALIADGAYRAGAPDGTWQQWADGRALGASALADGTGALTRWRADGTVAATTSWRAGVRAGDAVIFEPDGTELGRAGWVAGVRAGGRALGARTTIELRETWRDGHLVGARTVWRHGGRALVERYDAAGRLDGDWAAYRGTRVAREAGRYRAGERTGPWTWTDGRGRPERAGSYVGGRKDGLWTEWRDGVIASTARYRRGHLDGELVRYDARGREVGKDALPGGTGVARTFHPDGAVATETTLVRGQPHGPYRALAPRGQVIESGQHRDGARVGAWQRRDRHGALTDEDHFLAGALDGVSRRWRAGALVREATYVAGRRAGPYREAFADGTPALAGAYVDDRKDGAWTTYRRDGSVALVATFRAGLLDGPWQELAPDGTVRVRGQHQGGHRVGEWTTHTSAGEVRVDHGAPDPTP